MATSSEKAPGDISHLEHHDQHTTVKQVQNVALADATEKQKPSLLTRRMLMVTRTLIPWNLASWLTDLSFTAVCLSLPSIPASTDMMDLLWAQLTPMNNIASTSGSIRKRVRPVPESYTPYTQLAILSGHSLLARQRTFEV